MKLLYITNGICGSGGLERVLSVKASVLAEEYGYDITIATLNEEDHQPFYTFSPQVKFRTFRAAGQPLNYILQYRSAIKQLVKEVQPDVISVCDDGLKGLFIPRILGKKNPVIYERHASQNISVNADNSKGIKRWLTERMFDVMRNLSIDFDRFVVLTNGNLSEWPITAKLEVVPNPLSFYPQSSSSLTSKKVIAVGKQSYQKAYDLLLPIWKNILNMDGWELHIYGKLEPKLKLEKLRKDLHLEDSVFFHPPVKEIEKIFLDSSIHVLTSRFEGFGMVLIEAMACGVPVISFDCPHGPGDIITDGEDGFLIANGDTKTFSEQLGQLMTDETMRKKMGAAAKNNAKRYLPGEIIRQWHQLFKSLLS